MYLQQYKKYAEELHGITDARHRICLVFLAARAKTQSRNKRLEAASALYSPYLHKVQTYPLGYKLGNKISTPEVTASAQCGNKIRQGTAF